MPIVDSANHCEETMDNYNTNWSKTAGNTLSILPCSGDNTSNTSRFCKTDGQWEEPNYSNCIGKIINIGKRI